MPPRVLCQIHNRYEGKDISNHKRNLVIAGGVTLSVIVSPVVAAVTVGQSVLPLSVDTTLFNFSGILHLVLCKSLFSELIRFPPSCWVKTEQ